MKLDILDKKIIYELDKDSSQRSSVIAKKLDRSKEIINYRIHRLEKERILLGIKEINDSPVVHRWKKFDFAHAF